MVTRMLAAGQEEEEIRKSEILYLNEQKRKLPLNAIIVINNSKPQRVAITKNIKTNEY